MSSEKEIIMFQKSTVYDLLQLIKKEPDKTYTTEELEELFAAYVKGLEQSWGKERSRVTGSSLWKDGKMTAKERYDAKTAVRISLKLNKGTDADILQQLEKVPSKQGYIKSLIRADIATYNNKTW